MPEPIKVFEAGDVPAMLKELNQVLDAEAEATETEAEPLEEIQPDGSLIGVDAKVYQQINTALRSGKRHLLFYGPPGTGKTELAQLVAGQLSDTWHLMTGSADWSSQDVIGGYMPDGAGKLRFLPGLLLQHFNNPLIIDELNRCDIDKVLGPLFTVLSGQGTTLPYHFDPTDPESPRVSIHPVGEPEAGPKFVPGSNWRLIATINTLDRTSLYQMSYALMRRFAWIYVGVPADLVAFIKDYVLREYEVTLANPSPLAKIWEHINVIRALGPAPFIDIVKYLRTLDENFDLAAAVDDARRKSYLNAMEVFVFPLLDGIRPEQVDALATALGATLAIADLSGLKAHLKEFAG